jgi:hypothetical protein
MSQILPQLVPMIIGLLLSPIPIAALIIMLMTAHARRNGLAFITGWLLGIFGVGLVVISFPSLGAGSGGPLPYARLIRIILGMTLISWAIYTTVKRYRILIPETPRFFQKLDHIKATKAFGVGLLVSAGNIKNLGFSAAAALILNKAPLEFWQSFSYLLSYTLVGSITVLIPIGLYFLMQHKADPILKVWKGWLIQNHTYVLSAVVAFVGFMIMSGGH